MLLRYVKQNAQNLLECVCGIWPAVNQRIWFCLDCCCCCSASDAFSFNSIQLLIQSTALLERMIDSQQVFLTVPLMRKIKNIKYFAFI